MEYREITSRDEEEIKKLAEVFAGAFNAPPWNDSWSVETAQKRLSLMLDGKAAYALAAFDRGKIRGGAVGCFEIYCEKTVFNLREFFVDKDMKGRGEGEAMFKELKERLAEMGVNEMTLNTLRGRTENFYLRMGMENREEFTVMTAEIK